MHWHTYEMVREHGREEGREKFQIERYEIKGHNCYLSSYRLGSKCLVSLLASDRESDSGLVQTQEILASVVVHCSC